MKKALLMISLVGLIGSEAAIPKENAVFQRISLIGYSLLKESNELRIIKNDLIDTKRKLIHLDDLNELGTCHMSRLIENISVVEIICKYEGLILGTLHQTDLKNRLKQYEVHKNRLKDFTLKSLYLHYKATQPDNAKVGDKVILELTNKARKEMSVVAELIEEVMEILQPQSSVSP